ncbi:MAG TPA: CoA-binding protein [Vicinamibacterales bacterium]|nr:CoA-binding protein [Vicinamibacterales bacterium]
MRRDDSQVRHILETSQTIAMVGASSNPSKPSHDIMKGLLGAGFTVIPVNPTETEVLGRRAYPSLEDIPDRVDVVNVFRRPEQTPEIADAAVKIGARVLWLQTGIVSEEAARRARAGGLEVVMDECIGGTTARLRIRKARS